MIATLVTCSTHYTAANNILEITTMTTYTASLTITARTAWVTWYDASAIACTVTATAWGWYIAAFFSPAAQRRYEWVGQMIACLGLLAYLYGKRLRGVVQGWVDAQVEAAEVQPPLPTRTDSEGRDVTELPGLWDESDVVEAPAKPPTIRELKAQTKEAKIKGYGRMTSRQLLDALRAA